ncbi:MAG: hypothetical protein AB1782_03960 [Cyanobacteriota bacterium]
MGWYTTCIALIAISIYNIYEIYSYKEIAKQDYERSIEIYKLLKKARTDYEKKTKRIPQKFSEFVQLNGDLKEPYFCNLDKYISTFNSPNDNADLNKNYLNIKYITGYSVIFTINKENG